MAYIVKVEKAVWDDGDWRKTGDELVVCVDVEDPMRFLRRWANKEEKFIDGGIWGWVEYGEVRFDFWAVEGDGKIIDIDKAVEEIDKFIDVLVRKKRKERWHIEKIDGDFVLKRKGAAIVFDAVKYNCRWNWYRFVIFDRDWNEISVCTLFGDYVKIEGLDMVKKEGMFEVVCD